MIRLTKKQILDMHEDLLRQTGGSGGIRDEALLDSALSAPFQEFSGQEFFPTIEEKAARLGYGLIQNHAMLDGNKRLGAHAMLVFLALNEKELVYTQEELYTIILDLASGHADYEGLLKWIERHQR